MTNEPQNIINELNFVLTHPSCDAGVLEKYYSSWLYLYESVPLFTIIDHMRKAKPQLLQDWSKINKTVYVLLQEFESNKDSPDGINMKSITITIDLSNKSPEKNGIYQVPWETVLDDPIVNAHFKTKSILVYDKEIGMLDLVGISLIDPNHYHLYVKKGGK